MAGLGTAINTAGVMKIENGALVSGQAMMVVLCIALGALVGEMLNIEEWFERFGEWLKRKTGNAKDKNFVNGAITLLATLLKPIMTDLALNYLSMIGSILIFCVGINLVWGKKMRVANRLPSLGFAVIAAFLPISY